MRTEFVIVQTEQNGKRHLSRYGAEKLAIDKFHSAKEFYEIKFGWKVELYKQVFNGTSLHHSEKMG